MLSSHAGNEDREWPLFANFVFYSFLAFVCWLHSSSLKPAYYQAYFITRLALLPVPLLSSCVAKFTVGSR